MISNFGCCSLRVAQMFRACGSRPTVQMMHHKSQFVSPMLSCRCLLSTTPVASFNRNRVRFTELCWRGFGTANPRTTGAAKAEEQDQTETVGTDRSKSSHGSEKSDLAETIRKNKKGKLYNPVDLATSLDYLNSDVYHNIYRGKPVWFYYRRNFKGHFPPPRTRPNCVIGKKLITSNPCPICRDEYLVLDCRNIKLLNQFINPISSAILEPKVTGLCQHQHKKLLLEIQKAQDLGTIEMWLPFHLYDYRDYYDYLDPEELTHLLRASGYVPPVSSEDPTQIPTSHPSTSTLIDLPPTVQDVLLRTASTIPHAREFEPKLAEHDWRRPRVPNRYKMEEEHKARLLRQRRSRSLIFES